MKPHGYRWVCDVCKQDVGRSYKTDPFGSMIKEKYGEQLEQIRAVWKDLKSIGSNFKDVDPDLYWKLVRKHVDKVQPSWKVGDNVTVKGSYRGERRFTKVTDVLINQRNGFVTYRVRPPYGCDGSKEYAAEDLRNPW